MSHYSEEKRTKWARFIFFWQNALCQYVITVPQRSHCIGFALIFYINQTRTTGRDKLFTRRKVFSIESTQGRSDFFFFTGIRMLII